MNTRQFIDGGIEMILAITNIHGYQRMKPKDFDDHVIFYIELLSSQNFHWHTGNIKTVAMKFYQA